MKTITLNLRTEDAEPILRTYAELAARYGAYCDHIGRNCYIRPNPHTPLDKAKAKWREDFLRAKRVVESFGVEYEMTTEPETLTVHIPHKVIKSHMVNLGGVRFRHVDKWKPDEKNAQPSYRADVHHEACRHAAERVVRRWRESLQPATIALAG